MAIATIVCRGFGSFGGGVYKVPTRGYKSSPIPQTSGSFWRPNATESADVLSFDPPESADVLLYSTESAGVLTSSNDEQV